MDNYSGGKKKSRVILWIMGILLVPVAVFILYTWVTLNWSFSRGERVGYIQKLSKSGWICKTWEGEMAMVTMPGAIPDKFLFSVRDEKVAELINKFAGKRVSLVYEQHKGVPTSCFGETEYFIVNAKAIE
jgi:hypothetical protein